MSFSTAALAILVMCVEWIVLVAGVHTHEMIVGSVSVACAAIFLRAVQQSSTLRIKIQAADLWNAWRIPGYIVVDAWVVTEFLLKDLLQGHRGLSRYRVNSFKTSKRDPVLVGRRVLATLFTTASPNSIVIGIDYEQNRMLVHQLQPSGVSAINQRLGAKA